MTVFILFLKKAEIELKWTFKVKNRPVNKDHDVRGQVTTTFLKFPNLGLTDGEKCFVVARLKIALFQF